MLLSSSLAFIFGIFLYSFFQMFQIFWAATAILGAAVAVSIATRNKRAVAFAVITLFLALGILRTKAAFEKPDILKPLRDSGEVTTLTGIVRGEPDTRDTSTKLLVETEKAKILVTVPIYPEYRYGDRVRITGNLATPIEFPDFNYKEFLAKDGIFSVMYGPNVELLESGEGNIIYASILNIKSVLRESLENSLTGRNRELLSAMMLGDNSGLSQELKESLNTTGLRHITAVSGMHITIISNILMAALLGIGLWRRQAFYASIAALTFYIVMIGAPASAIRAGIMGSMLSFSRHVGRSASGQNKPGNSLRFLTLAAAIILILNPFLLWFDIGFQLSFLAMLGIIYLAPIFFEHIRFIPPKWKIREIIAMTLAAQIFTLPILIYNFGQVSTIAPIANILVVPLLGPILISGFLGILPGIALKPLGIIFSIPVFALLTYVSAIIDTASRVPFANIILTNVPWFWMIPYCLLAIFFIQKYKKSETNSLL